MRSILTLLLFLTLAPPALAVDGVLEINQTCAVQTGCFVGDAAGFPVTITTTGSYQLTSGLQVPNADTTALEIRTGDVTLDLNGFRILGGSTAGTGIGIYAPPPAGTKSGIVVKNGSVFGMGDAGILIVQSDVRVENMHVFLNRGLGVRVGTRSMVSGSIVSSSTGVGIQCDTASVVKDNAVNNNNGGGVLGSGLVQGNTVTNNTGVGIDLSRGLVIGNFVRANSADGLALGAGNVGYSQNVVTENSPNVSGGIDMGSNVCGSDTTCP